jgi:uncharacterized protein YjbI with pentapeptide repeats
MKVLKPQQLGILSRCFEHNRRFYMGVSALAMYPLGRTDTLLHEIAMWKLAAERLGAEGALDVGIPKSRGEFLVNGIAFAPEGVPQPMVPVRATVGEVQKDLAVHGDRYWTGRTATEPRPFTQMPIDWAHAFGGDTHPENPFGKGLKEVEIEGVPIVPLPNIESKHEPITSPRDRPLPAGFGPLDIGWPQRQRLAGTYDQHWLENLFPGFAKDVDWEIHNIAAPDQRRHGFWEGGERYRFENLHPTKAVEGELPSFRARVFVSRSHKRGELRPPGPELKQMVRRVPKEIEEIPLALQTLWFFPDLEIGVMIWSGSTLIAEELGEDILHLLVAAEHPGRPRSLEHYLQVMADRLHPETGGLALLNDDDLLPEELGPAESPIDAEKELGQFENFRMQNLHQRQVELTEAGRAEIASYGLDPDVHGPPVVPPLEPPPSPQQLSALIEKTNADRAKAEIEGKEKLAKSQAEIDAIVDAAGIEGFTSETLHEEQNPTTGFGPGPPSYTAAAILKRLQDLAMQSRESGYINDEIEGFIADKELYAQWEEGERLQRQGYHMGAHFQLPAPPMPDELRDPTRERVLKAVAEGEDFAQLNFTGADLSGMDLAGANLTGAYLESTNLTDTNLKGARLDGAVLAHATLTRTRFDGASLVDVNIGRAKLDGAMFTDADLSESMLYEAQIKDCSFVRAKLNKVTLMGAKFERCDASGCFAEDCTFLKVILISVNLRQAHLERTTWIENDLRGSAFDHASLVSATFLNTDLREVGFRGARLDNARFVEGTKLDQVVFSEASMLLTYCRGISMRGAEIRHATVDGADFSECDLAEAKFYRVVARGTRFEMADLRQAEMIAGNFMGASFARAAIYGADFRAANLHGADMARVRTDETVQLGEALLTKVRIHPRHEPEPQPGSPSA